MTQVKVSELTQALNAIGGILYLVQSGISKQIDFSDLIQAILDKTTYDPSGVEADAFDSDNHYYDDAISNLGVTDVQSAIDALSLLPRLRFGATAETSGNATINFSSTLGTTGYVLFIQTYDSLGRRVGYTRGAQTATGFTINLDFDATVIHLAIKLTT